MWASESWEALPNLPELCLIIQMLQDKKKKKKKKQVGRNLTEGKKRKIIT